MFKPLKSESVANSKSTDVWGLVIGAACITSCGKKETDCYEFCQNVPVRPSPKGIVKTRMSLRRKWGKVMWSVEYGYELDSLAPVT